MTANDNNVLTPDFKEIETKNPDEGLRQGLFEAQAARIVELQAEIASRQEEIDNLKSLILDSHPVGTYQAGNLKVQVKPGARRINAGTFEKAGDRTYTLRFDNSDEAVAITRLSRTALADIKKQINDFLKEVKTREHE